MVDETLARGVVGDQALVEDAEVATERVGCRFGVEPAVDPALDDEAVESAGVDLAAEAVAGLEQAHDHVFTARAGPLLNAVGGRQAADAAADNDNIHHASSIYSHNVHWQRQVNGARAPGHGRATFGAGDRLRGRSSSFGRSSAAVTPWPRRTDGRGSGLDFPPVRSVGLV